MRVGAYEIQGELGRGGRGVVYRARSTGGVEVAIKLVRTDRKDAFARFEREWRMQARLGTEEGFVPILDAGSAPQGPYIVMPLLPGGTLREKLLLGRLDTATALDFGEALARGLAAAHALGIVHRDLKPENILFTATGRPVIADLGLAKFVSGEGGDTPESRQLSKTGELRGTPGYMAPEQMSDSSRAGPPADVYALGAVLYECLAGAPAFPGESWTDVAAKVQQGTIEPIEEVRPDIPRWLAAVLKRCLAKDPERRFADGGALLAALRAGAAAPAKEKLPRSKVPVAAAFLSVIAVGAGAVVFTRPSPPSTAPATQDTTAAPVTTSAPSPPTPPPPPSPVPAGIDPRLVPATWIERARAKFKKGDNDGAIQDYSRAIELDEKCADAWDGRAHAKINKGDHAGVFTDADMAIRLDPNRASAWNARGWARLKKGDPQKGISDCSRALELDPNLAIAWRNRGLARGKRGDFEGEIQDCTRALELDPKLVSALFNRASAHEARFEWQLALADYRRILTIEPQNAKAVQRVGQLERGEAATPERGR